LLCSGEFEVSGSTHLMGANLPLTDLKNIIL
jgi:hypothetical protein